MNLASELEIFFIASMASEESGCLRTEASVGHQIIPLLLCSRGIGLGA